VANIPRIVGTGS